MGSNYVEAMCDKFIEEDRLDIRVLFCFVFVCLLYLLVLYQVH